MNTPPASQAVVGSRDAGVTALLRRNASWSPVNGQAATVTFSFPTVAPTGNYFYGENSPEFFVTFTEEQKQAARRALQSWSDVANITFQEVSGDQGRAGQIRFSNSTIGQTVAHAYYPNARGDVAGDIWIDPNVSSNLRLDDGEYGYLTMVHEVGHAIGLDHPGDYNGVRAGQEPGYVDDNLKYTVMSYFPHPADRFKYATAPLLHDIAAIQVLYGANTTAQGEVNTVYRWADRADIGLAIWDAQGIDTIDASNQSFAATLDLREGGFSSIGGGANGSAPRENVAIAFGTVIENATGTALADTLIGNSANNLLRGGGGKDRYVLSGEWGRDVITDSDRNAIVELTDQNRNALHFERQTDDLLITKTSGPDSLTVTGYFLAAQNFMITAAGETLTVNDINPVTAGDIDPDHRFGTVRNLNDGAVIFADTATGSDQDWFRVVLRGNVTYQYDLSSASPNGNAYDPAVSIRDENGVEVAFNDNGGGGTNARVRLRPNTGGTYYVVATADRAGNYRLEASSTLLVLPPVAEPAPAPTDLNAADVARTAAILLPGSSANGRIHSGNPANFYQVTPRAGVTYQFDALSQGNAGDTVLTLYSAAGKALKRNDDGGEGSDARLRFRAVSNETFYVEVGAKGDASYRIERSGTTLVLPEAQGTVIYADPSTTFAVTDIAGDTTTTAVLGPGQTADGTLTSSNDSDWFRLSLRAGVTYQFDAYGQPSSRGTASDTVLTLYNAAGTALKRNDNGGEGAEARLRYRAAAAETVYVGVSAKAAGSYAIERSGTTLTLPEIPGTVNLSPPSAPLSNLTAGLQGDDKHTATLIGS